jgi:hypothetical protein
MLGYVCAYLPAPDASAIGCEFARLGKLHPVIDS